jgi:hypothetical protein
VRVRQSEAFARDSSWKPARPYRLGPHTCQCGPRAEEGIQLPKLGACRRRQHGIAFSTDSELHGDGAEDASMAT